MLRARHTSCVLSAWGRCRIEASRLLSALLRSGVRSRRLGLLAGFVVTAQTLLQLPHAAAQSSNPVRNYAMGFLPSDPVEALAAPSAALQRGFLPERIDLSATLPPPGDQGEIGSCTAWATAYGAASYYARVQFKTTDLQLSPAYVYNQVKHDPNKICSGANLARVVEFVARRGAPLLNQYPAHRFCEPAEAAVNSASPVFRAAAYLNLAFAQYRSDGQRRIDRAVDVDLLRQELANGNPVIVGMVTTGRRLQDLPAGGIYDVQLASDPSYEHGGHALLIIGYDDERQAFRVMNSWGADWSDHGYGWISYSSAISEIEEAYVLVGAVPPPRPQLAPRIGPAPGPVHSEKGPVVGTNSCSAVAWQRTEIGVRLIGFAENLADREAILRLAPEFATRSGLSPSSLLPPDIAITPWPQCEALLTFGPLAAVTDRPKLATLDRQLSYRFGQSFGFTIETPDYPSFVYLIYLQADGKAVNLLPRNGPVRQQTGPRTVLRLGEPGSQGPHFRASDPSGYEVAVAIAARSPISELEELEREGGRYYKAGFDGRSATPGDAPDRRVLSAVRDAMHARPLPGEPSREISAAILLLRIGE